MKEGAKRTPTSRGKSGGPKQGQQEPSGTASPRVSQTNSLSTFTHARAGSNDGGSPGFQSGCMRPCGRE
eukprot:6118282-Pyramimonas_sp.AAC.1